MPKILQKLAFENEPCDAAATTWGSIPVTLGAGDQLPFLEFEKGLTVNQAEDNTIVSQGFPDTPIQTGKYVDKSGSLNLYYSGLDKLFYWAFGFELDVVSVCVFVISVPSVEPVAGAVYHDTDSTPFTFVRKEVNKSTTYYVFSVTGSVPVLATGNLTKQSGTGDATLTFSAHSVKMYEHLFELDATNRHFALLQTYELGEITGWDNDDYYKNRMATIGLKTAVTDFLYANAMCKRFGLKSSAGQMAVVDFNFCAYTENRGNYDSSNWTPSITDNSLAAIHHHIRFKIGADEDNLVNLGVSDVDFSVDIPIDNIQDTESGLFLAEPRMEGKYKFDFNAKLSRYSIATYQSYRDAWTSLVACIEGISGYYRFDVLFNSIKILNAGPDSDNVEKEPLKMEISYDTTNNWPLKLANRTLVQKSPIILMVRNLNSSNAMITLSA